MTRNALAICCLVLAPLAGLAEGTGQKPDLPDLALQALAEKAGGADHLSTPEFSTIRERNGAPSLCATTNAYDSNGYFIGLTYWQVEFNADGTEVTSLRNVTGLNSACYSESYRGPGN
ncbi:hypothetical protein QO034_10815 [Sedimentitalea sp. JM2-8]|uniref:Uncharacterized protein n=1 Tax=Sedimentitalea xiamensis TaxID=3050037 RepID=A0ABT7FES2_9RHOB|nr:hypothetical protein [Sedimentitalea xiamensis]MDK3073603.1 hypothetical protein [Sedimentitalea xiamensis]